MGLLGAEHHFQVVDIPRPQFLAHDPRQGAAGGFGDVGDGQQLRLQFVAGAQGRQNGDAPLPRLPDQIQLAADQINGVHDVVVPVDEKGFPVGRVVQAHDGMHHRVGADVPAAGGGGLRLGKAHSGVKSVELAVDVGDGHGVAVDEGQLPHTGAAQGLRHIAAYAAQAEHRHMAAPQFIQSLTAQDHFRSQKFFTSHFIAA